MTLSWFSFHRSPPISFKFFSLVKCKVLQYVIMIFWFFLVFFNFSCFILNFSSLCLLSVFLLVGLCKPLSVLSFQRSSSDPLVLFIVYVISVSWISNRIFMISACLLLLGLICFCYFNDLRFITRLFNSRN